MSSSGDEWCRHYGGTAYPGSCKAGVDYDTVADDSQRPRRWACTCPEVRHLCPSFEGWTQEELDAQNADIAAFLNKMAALMSRESEDCCQCGKHVERMEKVGRCVYARPCNCRLWQGKVPQAWK
jgi:hypothetical protein